MRKNIVLSICVTAALVFSCSPEKIVEDVVKEQEEILEELIKDVVKENETEEEAEEEKEEEAEGEKEEGTDQSAMLHGKWEATELKIDSNTASDQLKFGKQILDHLTDKECFIISFIFNSDLTVMAENSVNYLEINVGGTGLDVPCPEKKDTESSMYTYDGATLTLINGDNKKLILAVTVEENTMTVDAKDLDLPNFNEDGQLIFTKVEE